MKNGKAAGNDNMKTEEMKTGGNIATLEIVKLFIKCVNTRKIPAAWKNANMIIMLRKATKT